MRNRSGVVIIEENSALLMERIRDGKIYYVFPSGGIETGEPPIVAAKPEAKEELGVEVRIEELISVVSYSGEQYYFLASILAGEVGTGKGVEYTTQGNRGTYRPLWLPISALNKLDVRPKEVADKIQKAVFN